MIVEQKWKQKPKKLTVIQAHVNDHEAVKEWLGASKTTVIYQEDEPARMVFEGGAMVRAMMVGDGDFISRDDDDHLRVWVSEVDLKTDHKRA